MEIVTATVLTVRLFHRHKLLHVVNERLDVFEIGADAAHLLLIEIGRQLFEHDDLAENATQARGRSRFRFCKHDFIFANRN